MQTSPIFSFKITQEGPALTRVSLFGELRRGLGQSAELLSFQAGLPLWERRAVSGVIIFDLSGLKYWDTMGINELIPVVRRINARNSRRAGLFGSKDTVVFEAAKDKFADVGTDAVPWEETEEALLGRLTG